ncbi:hypothetical protein phiPsa267_168 [Pseudomonas phage phiPsa267]|uniref:DUF7227 domain-containing protein n=2 Tax=Otagovirus TaxID=2560197 RepID=A0A7G9V0T3_9CAUD|nr:hypothetical protein QGX18_gp062 [Pseudomonas phage phiPsa347]YP_010767778.1 hypothetical protein QGX19_gp062 [Pseudomonas phage phiPsa267]QNN99888.1 hypothetical protein phiPsa267_168 [Pseudomonas phage phiPsa267]QNO00408.1 hypothetical protein phiPsa347_166 [Pseudomonas phage phiPsa347]
MAFFVLNPVSGNAKTGPMPVSTSNSATCPDACPIKVKGCYAKYGPVGMHWRKLDNGESKNAASWPEFVKQVKGIAKGSLWRHNQAGDLVGTNDVIDNDSLEQLVWANRGKKGFTYTHYPVLDDQSNYSIHNRNSIGNANSRGFTINLSGNDTAHADKLKALNIGPVVTLMPRDAEKVSYTPNGNKVVICPAENSDKVNCLTCGLCQVVDRNYIIGFRAHGTAAKTVELIAKG